MFNTNKNPMETFIITLSIALVVFILYSTFLATRINVYKSNIDLIKSDNERLFNINNNLKQEVDSKITYIDSIRGSLLTAQNLNKEYQTTTAVLEGKNEELKNKNIELSSKLEQENKIHRELEVTRLADIKSLREQNIEADKMIQAHIDERDGYRKTINELRENNKVLKSEKDSLEMRVKNDTSTISKIKKELSTTKGVLTKTKTYLENARKTIEKFNESQKEKKA